MAINVKLKPEVQAMLESAPEFTLEEMGIKPGKVIARGFDEFKEYLKKQDQMKTEEPKVKISRSKKRRAQ